MFASVGANKASAARRRRRAVGRERSTHNAELSADHGFNVVGFEDTAPMDNARLGRAGRDEEIDNVIKQVEHGPPGHSDAGYNWMALSSWGRTNNAIPARGGALVTGFTAAAEAEPPLVEPGELTESSSGPRSSTS